MTQDCFQLLDATFYCQSADGQAKAQGRLEGLKAFLVFAESKAKGHPNRFAQKELVKKGVLEKRGGLFVFLKDFTFQQPSPAAETVLGRRANGWKEWKTENGQTLGELAGRGQ
ncbi:MAG: DUF4357 domain-containing protein [Planctomycetes bacterium]|nr:DUF4357 domain-containing protein [Planctomycetota bacterium]